MPRSSFGYLEDNTRLKSQILWSLCSSSDRVILCWLLFLLSVKENQFNFTELNCLRLLLIHHALLTVNRKKYLFINLCAVLQTFFPSWLFENHNTGLKTLYTLLLFFKVSLPKREWGKNRFERHSPIPPTKSIYKFILLLNAERCYQQSEFMIISNYY